VVCRILFVGTASEVVDSVEIFLKDAVRHQIMGDVPLGAYLFGEIYSTVIAALMQAKTRF
jgi:asparagine synthase (glutamine-hydrolysing)